MPNPRPQAGGCTGGRSASLPRCAHYRTHLADRAKRSVLTVISNDAAMVRKQHPSLEFGQTIREAEALLKFGNIGTSVVAKAASYVEPTIPGPIVELGSGDVADLLLRRGVEASRLILVNANSDFCSRLQARFPSSHVRKGSALDLRKILRGVTKEAASAVVSMEPVFVASWEVRMRLLAQVLGALRVNAPFVQITHLRDTPFPKGRPGEVVVEGTESISDERRPFDLRSWPMRVWVYRPTPAYFKNIARARAGRVGSGTKPSRSVGRITHDIAAPLVGPEFKKVALPKAPAKLWPGRPPGRPKGGEEDKLIAHIREVYGHLIAQHRDEIRSYIFEKDRRLWRAIDTFEKSRSLPDDIAMPTRAEIVQRRVMEAADGVIQDKAERRSVTGKVWRDSRRNRPA